MKKFRTVMISLLTSFVLVFGLALFAACGGDNTGGGTYYEVTVSPAEHGTVTVSDPASSEGYVSGETVTVTATPDEYYEVSSVTANSSALTAGSDGKYTFTVSGNTTVSAVFELPEASEDALILSEAMYGVFQVYDEDEGEAESSAEVADVVVTPYGTFWGEDEVLLVEETDFYYSVTVDGTAYQLIASESEQELSINSLDYTVDYTFKKVNPTYAISFDFDESHASVSLSPEKARYGVGETVQVTITPVDGYQISSLHVNLDAEEPADGFDGAYTFEITVEGSVSVSASFELTSIPSALQGEWFDLTDETVKLTIGADSVTWTGHEVEYTGISEYEDFDMETYLPYIAGYRVSLTIDGESNDFTWYLGASAIEIEVVDVAEMTSVSGYFAKGDGVAFEEVADGAFSCILDGGPSLTIGNGVVTIAEDPSSGSESEVVAIYYLGEDGGKNYVFEQMGTIGILTAKNENYLQLTAIVDGDEQIMGFVRDEFTVAPPAALVGEWTGSDGSTLTVAEDGTVTSTGDITIKLLAVHEDGSFDLLATSDSGAGFTDGISISFYDGQLNFSIYEPDYITYSMDAEKLVLSSDQYGGYTLDDGQFFFDFSRFNVDAEGVATVDNFGVPQDYAYLKAQVSENVYEVYFDGSEYTFTVSGGKITVTDSHGSYTFTKGAAIELVETFTVDYECDNGSLYFTELVMQDDNTYKIAKSDEPVAISFTITPYPGYKVKSVQVGGADVPCVGEVYTYTADGQNDVHIVVTFETVELEVLTADAKYDGWTDENNDVTFNVGSDGKVTVNGTEVYVIRKMDDDEIGDYQISYNGNAGTITFADNYISMSGNMFEYDYYFTASSSGPVSYTVTITYSVDGDGEYDADAMGSAHADKDSYSDGETVTITVEVKAGYTATVTASGEVLSLDGGVYKFEIHADTDVVVTFAANS